MDPGLRRPSRTRPNGDERINRRVSSVIGMTKGTRLMSTFMTSVQGSWSGRKFGVVTAGDDTQGMNACVRAIARMGMYLDCHVVFIYKGYHGLVEGGDNFVDASWSATSDLICQGGTALKSYKCPLFRERSARLKAAKNMVEHGIHYLIAIGGDGTLRGLQVFQDDWTSLLQELEDMDVLDKELLHENRHLKVVGVICTVENNVIGTDVAIGVNSALHRIVECADDIVTTASGNTAFIMQVFGKTNGYLALASAIACDATMVFLPEWPPEGDWKEELVQKVIDSKRHGTNNIMVFMTDSSTDIKGNPIKPEDVAKVLETRVGLHVMTTALGHVQLGGTPSASDRILASRVGAEAVLALRDLPEEVGSCAMATKANEVVIISLSDCVQKTDEVERCIEERRFADAVRLKGSVFQAFLSSYTLLHSLKPAPILTIAGLDVARKIGIMRVGSSSLGFCSVCKSVVGYCASKGIGVAGIHDGFEGMIRNQVQNLTWQSVGHWNYASNTCLGFSRKLPSEVGIDKIATAFTRLHLSGLIIVGTFRALESIWELWNAKEHYNPLCVPMLMVPASITNDIPDVETSLGADTALNEVVNYCDKMRRVARGHGNSVFVIETMGKNCGYLTLMGAVASGADAAYTKQGSMGLHDLLEDASVLREKVLNSGVKIALILMSEQCNPYYDADFVQQLLAEEGKGVFECRAAKVGHIQMGGVPSPFDRLVGIVLGLRAAEWMVNAVEDAVLPNGDLYTKHPQTTCIITSKRTLFMFKPIVAVAAETDFQTKMPTFLWWNKLRPLQRILTKHYDTEYSVAAEDNWSSDEDEEDKSRAWIGTRTPSAVSASTANLTVY